MTSRQIYEAVLIELNKENAPNITLEDFNYFVNKAINQYVNKRYNIYDVNQQTTDDLRVLKATTILDAHKIDQYDDLSLANHATYEVILPNDYLHILNCICIYKVNKTFKCYNAGDTWRAPATRLTSDAYSQVLDNFWNKPTYKRPYYYIHNVNKLTNGVGTVVSPTNPIELAESGENKFVGTDVSVSPETFSKFSTDLNDLVVYDGTYHVIKGEGLLKAVNGVFSVDVSVVKDGFAPFIYDNNGTLQLPNGTTIAESDITFADNENIKDGLGNFIGSPLDKVPTSIKLSDGADTTRDYSNIERTAGVRYGNVSLVRMEIRYGSDNSVFELSKVYVDYIKAPQTIRLTQEEVDRTEDISQMLEYPDYVCQEIINELVLIILENITDLRVLTHPVVSLSIANPTQGLTA